MANLLVKGAVGSDIGTSRYNNEDNYYLNGKIAEYTTEPVLSKTEYPDPALSQAN